jgi:hypothetical protein
MVFPFRLSQKARSNPYLCALSRWYIIPGEMVVGQGSIALYPKLKGAKYGPYKEAWAPLLD